MPSRGAINCAHASQRIGLDLSRQHARRPPGRRAHANDVAKHKNDSEKDAE